MDTHELVALVAGIAWASGINLYATILFIGLLGYSGTVQLPPMMAPLSDPVVILAAGFMYCTEFIIDKIPGLDSIWDGIHTFIRIPAGALLALSAVTGMDPAVEFSALMLGGTLAASSHGSKTGTRLLLNTSPEPVSNWASSISEDILVIIGLWMAIYYPWIFLAGLIIFLALLIMLLPRLIKLFRKTFLKLRNTISGYQSDKKPSP